MQGHIAAVSVCVWGGGVIVGGCLHLLMVITVEDQYAARHTHIHTHRYVLISGGNFTTQT